MSYRVVAIRGRVPRETARREPQEIAVEPRTPDQALVERAVDRAGSLKALASAIGREKAASDLSKARTGSRPLTGPLRALLLEYVGGSTGAEDGAEDGDDESPRVDLAPATARTPDSAAPATAAPGVVRLELGPEAARELYQLARETGRSDLALRISDALLRRTARGRVMGRPSVTPRIVALVDERPGLSARQIADAIGCERESVRILANAAARAGRIERRIAPPSADGPRWLYFPAVAS